MKLKTKLLIAFFTITLVPVLMVSAVVVALGNYQVRSIEKAYGISGDIDILTGNSVQIFNRLTRKIQQEIQVTIKEDPGQLTEEAYLDRVNQELLEKYSCLLVRKGNYFVYSGAPEGSNSMEDIYRVLPSHGDYTEDFNGGTYLEGDNQYLIKQMDFIFADGSDGSAFIVTKVSEFIPEMRSMYMEMLIAIVMVLMFTGAALALWIYSTILKPLDTLRAATKNIKDGLLDFTLDVTDNDEIGLLCQDFEEMRQRLKESAEEKLQYDKENKELISNISHDLKTPITAIKGYVEGILDGVASSPEKLDKYIRTIYNKANDMDRLIDELTFYSKIDTNKIPYTFAKIKVSDYFADCVEELGLDMDSKGIELGYFNYVDEDTVIIADTEQLKRVINNIVGNSVKYLDKRRGIVNIRIKDAGDFIQVEIEDNGKGIAQKDLPYIFDRFYRTDSSRNSSQGGSGIGLSIVKKIIEDHGGRIWATSKEITGTEMHFVLRKYQEVIQDE